MAIMARSPLSLVAPLWMSALLAASSSTAVVNAFTTSATTPAQISTRCALPKNALFAKNKWDTLIDEDEDEDLQFNGGPPVPRDMKYNMYNLQKQRENYESMKAVGGKDITNDVYARDPEEDTFWFVGKIARVGDVTVEKAMARLWPMIEEHSARLRPVELYPKWGKLELWVSPGDSELDVAYCKPELVFVQMFREIDGVEDISKAVRNVEIGFQGELYENNEEGFRTVRSADGKAVKPELKATSTDRQPTEAEMDEMMEILNSQVEASSE